MSRFKKLSVVAFAGFGVSLLASSLASAGSLALPVGDVLTGTLTLSTTPVNLGLGTANSAPGLFNINVNNKTGDSSIYYAGEIYWANAFDSGGYLGGGKGPSTGTASFVTFCTQLYTDVYIGHTESYTVMALSSVADVSSTAKATLIDDVITAAQSQISNTATANNAAAGAQVAIWKIIYDFNGNNTSLSDTGGTITWDSSTTWGGDAVTYLTDATNGSVHSADNVFGLKSSDGTQNQSILAQILTPTPKPLAGSVILFGILAAGAYARRAFRLFATPAL